MNQFHHDIRSFAARLQASPSGKGTSIAWCPVTEKVFVLRSGKQAVADRNERVSVRPAKGEHPEPRPVLHGTVVKDSGKQLHLFRAGAVKQAVINNKDVFAAFIRQRFHENVDDAGRKQCCEALPVYPGIVQEAIDGIL
jgi:hypothetical protein